LSINSFFHIFGLLTRFFCRFFAANIAFTICWFDLDVFFVDEYAAAPLEVE
jgi:hypothetical protein